ncbi:hypothetical protein CR513_27203, partial [Mucuna pruriens]
MKSEFDTLQHNATWTLTLFTTWPTTLLAKYNACLVAKGFHQQFGHDYSKTFSPVIKPVTIHLILTLAVTYWSLINNLTLTLPFPMGYLRKKCI